MKGFDETIIRELLANGEIECTTTPPAEPRYRLTPKGEQRAARVLREISEQQSRRVVEGPTRPQ